MRRTVGKIAIAFLLSLPLFLPGSSLFSQSAAANRPELDHTTVFVRDLPKSVEFYEKVVGLERIPDPFKDSGLSSGPDMRESPRRKTAAG
jgi:hypothetical protein